MALTTNNNDPNLGYGYDTQPVPQNSIYLVLSDEEKKKGFVRPVRQAYTHLTCKTETIMNRSIAETYARDPKFYGSTYCVKCQMHRPVSEFVWSSDRTPVGS